MEIESWSIDPQTLTGRGPAHLRTRAAKWAAPTPRSRESSGSGEFGKVQPESPVVLGSLPGNSRHNSGRLTDDPGALDRAPKLCFYRQVEPSIIENSDGFAFGQSAGPRCGSTA